MKYKRVFIGSDTHSGHRAGLTPPPWHRPHSRDKLDKIQIELWKKWKKEIDAIKPIDIAFWNGDCIDGRNKPNKELITGDRREQAQIAACAMKETEAPVHVITTGTTYHVGIEDFEKDIIYDLGDRVKQIGAHNYVDVNGLVFDLKHKCGSSSVPRYGKFTPIAKESLWGKLWADKGWPDAKIVIRSHTHEFAYCGDFNFLGLTTPGLQAASEFGKKNVSRTIDWGFVYFDVYDKDYYQWKPVALKLQLIKSQVLKL